MLPLGWSQDLVLDLEEDMPSGQGPEASIFLDLRQHPCVHVEHTAPDPGMGPARDLQQE